MTILALLGGGVILIALAAGGWLVTNMRNQQERLAERLDALADRLAAPVAVHPTAAMAAPEPVRIPTVGDAAPAFELDLLGGGRAGLAALLARNKPLMLVFTHPRCGPCYELLPDIGVWQRVYGDRVTIALVSAGARETNAAMTAEYGVGLVLLQQEQELADAFGIAQMPGALLIAPDGRIAAEPRYGAHAVRRFVADTLGLAMPETPAVEVRPVKQGQRLPALRRPDLAGNVVDLAAPRREPLLLLFWSPGCTHCTELLPELLAFERAVGPDRMMVVSRGPLGLNQEVGFQSTVLLDDDRSIGRLLGVSGTPAALLIDSRGVVATPVARGLAGVRSAINAVGTVFGQTVSAAAAD